ncbi:SDR family oxidoreductase [uncultured Albimonas sp.]|uniref:SDR family NAD(P)-dependent oxidoreductase n=1 Tax=uncultured Albimonas sp. TaxID=1331701 RepID=UPI0030ED57AE
MAKNPFDLSGRVAVVTGGNGGIGLGMAEGLAAMGANVAVWARNEEKNARALKRLADAPGEAMALPVDVNDAAAVEAAMAQTLERFGRVDGMFANAGISARKSSILERTEEDWLKVLEANVLGVHRCFKAAAAHMVERAKDGDAFGRLVVTSSTSTIFGAATSEPYGASKGAVLSMMRALAVELARFGITANAILPGWTESEMTAPAFANEKFVKATMARTPIRRYCTPEDFSNLAVYLMTNGASAHTGDCLRIDGGYSIF